MHDFISILVAYIRAFICWLKLQIFENAACPYRHDEVWIFGTDGNRVSDDILTLVKWMHDQLPDVQCFVVAGYAEKRKDEIAKYADIVNPHSKEIYSVLKHAQVAVSDQPFGYAPDQDLFYILRKHRLYRPKYVEAVLYTGEESIIPDVWHESQFKPDIILTSTKAARDYLRGACKQPRNSVLFVGTPRLDKVLETEPDKKERRQVLYITAQRPWINPATSDNAMSSDANSRIMRLLSDKRFDSLLEKYNAEAVACIPWVKKFTPVNSRVRIADKNEDKAKLIRNADLLITDYTGYWQDMLLLNKQTLFYVFDKEKYKTDGNRAVPEIIDRIGFVSTKRDDIYDAIEYILGQHADFRDPNYRRDVIYECDSYCEEVVRQIAMLEEKKISSRHKSR